MGSFLSVAKLAHRPVPFTHKQLFGLEDVLRRHQNVQVATLSQGDMAVDRYSRYRPFEGDRGDGMILQQLQEREQFSGEETVLGRIGVGILSQLI